MRLWPARWQQNPQNVISGFGSFGGVTVKFDVVCRTLWASISCSNHPCQTTTLLNTRVPTARLDPSTSQLPWWQWSQVEWSENLVDNWSMDLSTAKYVFPTHSPPNTQLTFKKFQPCSCFWMIISPCLCRSTVHLSVKTLRRREFEPDYRSIVVDNSLSMELALEFTLDRDGHAIARSVT